MGGSTGVESRLGAGSKFWFEVPLLLNPQETAPSAQLEGQRLLIIGDRDISLRILRKQVGAWGLRNDIVESGRAAIRALSQAKMERDPYRFLLIDDRMPQADRCSIAAAVRSTPGTSDIPIIMLTPVSYSPGACSQPECDCATVDTRLTKPVRQSHLLRR